MTIPARVPSAHMIADDTHLPIGSPTRPDAAPILAAALDRGVSAKAYVLLAATVLRLPADEWLTIDSMAEAAGFSGHQGRPLVAELVRAGLVRKMRKLVYSDDRTPSIRFRYAVEVAA